MEGGQRVKENGTGGSDEKKGEREGGQKGKTEEVREEGKRAEKGREGGGGRAEKTLVNAYLRAYVST